MGFRARQGTYSECKGDLLSTATAGELVVKGVLTVVRGNIGFLDRRFNLTNGIYTILRGGSALSRYRYHSWKYDYLRVKGRQRACLLCRT